MVLCWISVLILFQTCSKSGLTVPCSEGYAVPECIVQRLALTPSQRTAVTCFRRFSDAESHSSQRIHSEWTLSSHSFTHVKATGDSGTRLIFPYTGWIMHCSHLSEVELQRDEVRSARDSGSSVGRVLSFKTRLSHLPHFLMLW